MLTCSYINLSDQNKNILSFLCIGFIDISKFKNPYSISQFIFRGNKGLYEKEYIESEMNTIYTIFDDKIMKELKDISLKTPKSDIDYDEYKISKMVLDWIEKEIKKYNSYDVKIVLETTLYTKKM